VNLKFKWDKKDRREKKEEKKKRKGETMLINRHARLGYGSEWVTGNEMVCLSIKPQLVYFCYWGPNGLIRSYINGLYCNLSQGLYCRWSFLSITAYENWNSCGGVDLILVRTCILSSPFRSVLSHRAHVMSWLAA
jgi:hypothetical protein